jgi:hypothetical protein
MSKVDGREAEFFVERSQRQMETDEVLVQWADAYLRFHRDGYSDDVYLDALSKAEKELLDTEWFGLEIIIRNYRFILAESAEAQSRLDRKTSSEVAQRFELFFALEKTIEKFLLDKAEKARTRLRSYEAHA